VGMFDAANGSVRQSVMDFAVGRNDPQGPLGPKEYFVNMDRYCAFAYHALIAELVEKAADSTRRPAMSQMDSPMGAAGGRKSSPDGFGESPR